MTSKITPKTESEARGAATSLVETEGKNAVNTGLVTTSNRAEEAGVASGNTNMARTSPGSGGRRRQSARGPLREPGENPEGAKAKRGHTAKKAAAYTAVVGNRMDAAATNAADGGDASGKAAAAPVELTADIAVRKAGRHIVKSGKPGARGGEKAEARTAGKTGKAPERGTGDAGGKVLERKTDKAGGKKDFAEVQKKINQNRSRSMRKTASGTVSSAVKAASKRAGEGLAKIGGHIATKLGIWLAAIAVPILILAVAVMPFVGSCTAAQYMSVNGVVEIPYEADGVKIGSAVTVTRIDITHWKPNTPTYSIYEKWIKAGSTWKNHIAVLDGRYLIACTTTFGNVGDDIDFITNNNEIIPCTIMDTKKSTDKGCTKWGHDHGQSVIEFEVENAYYAKHSNPGRANNWPLEEAPNYYTPKTGKKPCYLVRAINYNRCTAGTFTDVNQVLETNCKGMDKKEIEEVKNTAGIQGIAIRAALSKIGCPYEWGAIGPRTFDCSGLCYWSYRQAKVTIPRATGAYKGGVGKHWKQIGLSEVQPGDILCMDRGNGVGHAAMYLSGGYYVEAPRAGENVRISSGHSWNCAFRVVE